MHVADEELEILREQSPPVQTLPFLAKLSRDAELDLALLEIFEHFVAVPAEQFQLQSIEQLAEFDNVRSDQRWVDSVGNREPKRANFTLLDCRSERTGAERAFVTLLQQGEHTLAEIGELGMRSLAPEQIAAKLAFELADSTGQRWLGNMAFFGSAGEIERSRHSEEVTYLMHFHQKCTSRTESRPG